jgi:hypothetical protein
MRSSWLLAGSLLLLCPMGCLDFSVCEDTATCGSAEVPEEETPAGWSGPYVVRVKSDSLESADACADGKEPKKYSLDPPDSKHECVACGTCVTDSPSCELPRVACWKGSDTCEGTERYDFTIVPNTCDPQPGAMPQKVGQWSCAVQGAPKAPECTVTGDLNAGKVQNLPGWKRRLDVCDAPAAHACDKAEGCGLEASISSEDRLCIRQEGDMAGCPPGWTDPLLSYMGASDTRSCTPCSCSATCDSWDGFTVYDGNGCNAAGDGSMNLPPSGCFSTGPQLDQYEYSFKSTPPQATCTVTESKPEGTFEPIGPVTFCCKPLEAK